MYINTQHMTSHVQYMTVTCMDSIYIPSGI
jgi:hypothetical protein